MFGRRRRALPNENMAKGFEWYLPEKQFSHSGFDLERVAKETANSSLRFYKFLPLENDTSSSPVITDTTLRATSKRTVNLLVPSYPGTRKFQITFNSRFFGQQISESPDFFPVQSTFLVDQGTIIVPSSTIIDSQQPYNPYYPRVDNNAQQQFGIGVNQYGGTAGSAGRTTFATSSSTSFSSPPAQSTFVRAAVALICIHIPLL
jgi:hypothetical protein